jgi:hypothetical protein
MVLNIYARGVRSVGSNPSLSASLSFYIATAAVNC